MRPAHILLFITFFTSSVLCQTEEASRKLQIAQRLEQAGDWKQATVVYEDLWRSDTTNYVYFDALRRAYGQLKEYDKAIRIIEYRMHLRPAEFYLAAYLGGVHFDAGHRPQADSVWDALLASYPKQRQMYVLIAQQMQERRLFGRAIGIYLRGREATGNNAEFAQELALLYSATQAYGDAVGEYLLLLEQTPHQLGYVQSRIASFTIRDEGLRQAEAAVAAAVEKRPANTQFKTLYAWVLMEEGRYADALPVYRTIDSVSASNGSQLFSFAGMAIRAGRFAEASLAYREIVALDPPSPLRPRSLYGMAEAYEQTLSAAPAQRAGRHDQRLPVPESAQPPDSALMLYDQVISQYPGSQPALQSLYRIGIIRFERQFDLDGALRALDEVRTDRRAGNLAWEALLTSTDVLLGRGDVQGARDRLLEAPQEARAYLQDRFTLRYAWLTYVLGDFVQAQALLRGVTQSLNRDAANDGLTLYYHIQEGAVDSSTLVRFSRGELLTRQRKFSEALEEFLYVSMNAKTATLASRSRLESADMLVRLGKPEAAIHLLDSVVSTYQTDVLRDRAMYRLGMVYEQEMRDPVRATETYEKFLVLFPTSIFADDVRQRVRSLKGDAS